MMDRRLPGGFVSQPTTNPLLCSPNDKARLEAANCVAQLELIEELVENRKITAIRESHVLELHRLAIEGIYGCGARYREVTRTAVLEGGGATHVVAEPATIAAYVREALDVINGPGPALDRAAYALWRFNWIHPFAGGNGRTARAIAYLVLCIDFGRLLPGKPTFPTLISEQREEYQASLRRVEMYQLVATATIQQLRSAIEPDLDA